MDFPITRIGQMEEKYHRNTNVDLTETQCTKYNSWWQHGNSQIAATSRFTDHSIQLCGIEMNDLNYNSMMGCECLGNGSIINKMPLGREKNKWSKPDEEIDRLRHKLEEAQKFVDSLGKVPGIAGLGLMDPSERPYFHSNRQTTDEQSSNIINKNNSKQLPIINSHNKSSLSTSHWIKATPFTISVPGRGGIVREAIIPEKQHTDVSKPNEVIETGPCGEINCRSRLRKLIERAELVDKIDNNENLNSIINNRNLKKEKKYDAYHERRRRRRRRRRRKRESPSCDGLFKTNRLRRVSYVYFAGDTYPVSVYGHKNCNEPRKRVPANMGWLWTQYKPTERLKPRVGWRPGAISRQIRELIQKDKASSKKNQERPASVPASDGIRRRKVKTQSYTSLKKVHTKKVDDEDEEYKPPSTLRIKKTNRNFNAIMYTVKDEKNDKPILAMSNKRLEITIPKNSDDLSDATNSTDSDIDIDFSPPAAVNRYKKKPNVIHVETQIEPEDIIDTSKPVDNEKKETKTEKKMKKKKKSKKKNKKKKDEVT